MSRYDPTAVAIEELRAFGIAPTESGAADPATIRYSFLSTRENNSLLRPWRAAAELGTTTAHSYAESFAATEIL